MSIIEDICYKQGHRIQSLRAADAFDPVKLIVLQRYEIRCVYCGKGVDEIEKFKRAGRSGSRKPKGQVTNEHNHSSAAGSEAGSQDSVSSAVRST